MRAHDTQCKYDAQLVNVIPPELKVALIFEPTTNDDSGMLPGVISGPGGTVTISIVPVAPFAEPVKLNTCLVLPSW